MNLFSLISGVILVSFSSSYTISTSSKVNGYSQYYENAATIVFKAIIALV